MHFTYICSASRRTRRYTGPHPLTDLVVGDADGIDRPAMIRTTYRALRRHDHTPDTARGVLTDLVDAWASGEVRRADHDTHTARR